MTEEVRKRVYELLAEDNSGHGKEHIERVLKMSLKFAEAENADKETVALTALLHDVDDYKLFGAENAANLTNTERILKQCSVEGNIKERVLTAVKAIGYSKRLQGVTPVTIEGKIVSDADMCDAVGVTGILRSYRYNLAHGNLFFDRNIYPVTNMSAAEYMAKNGGTVVTHMFEKSLRLKDLMLTDSGKKEAIERHNITVEFLYHFFEEENAPEWIDYLDNYLNKTML